MSITPWNNCVFGTCPIAINNPAQSIVLSSPEVFRTFTPVTLSCSTSVTSVTSEFHTISILSWDKVRSAMIFEARNSSRR